MVRKLCWFALTLLFLFVCSHVSCLVSMGSGIGIGRRNFNPLHLIKLKIPRGLLYKKYNNITSTCFCPKPLRIEASPVRSLSSHRFGYDLLLRASAYLEGERLDVIRLTQSSAGLVGFPVTFQSFAEGKYVTVVWYLCS